MDNFYFGKKNNGLDTFHINGPFNISNIENDTKITGIGSLKNNELICISFNNGKVKIFDSNKLEADNYPQYTINEFSPKQGVNSLYISNDENSIWRTNNTNKNEIIYLNGYEEIKIIQMNNDYKSHAKLYTIKDDNNNISNSIELDYNSILLLTATNTIKLVTINKNKSQKIIDEKKKINNLLVDEDKSIKSVRKLSKNVISLG